MEKLLEDAGIKLSVFISDIFGVSGRAMLAALIAGECDPEVLAEHAHGRMRPKIPALVEALTGHFSGHHAFLCQTMLGRIDGLDATIATVSDQIEAEIAPFQAVVDRLDTIPGVNQRVAQVIVAEVGVDMTRFPTAGHLASWAGMCPGNNESAGKHFSGRTRKGDRWLRAALGEAAAAGAGTKDTYCQALYRRLAHRRGKKRALVAVGHSQLIAVWHIIGSDVEYRDLGPLHFLTRVDRPRQTRRLVTQLQQLGYLVRLDPARAG
jgi:transposase